MQISNFYVAHLKVVQYCASTIFQLKVNKWKERVANDTLLKMRNVSSPSKASSFREVDSKFPVG